MKNTKSKAQFDTFSLAEIFSETNANGVWMLVENDDGTVTTFAAYTEDPWLAVHEHVTTKLFNGVADRVSLYDTERDGCLIMARLKSGLYRVVGFNRGHYDGAFKRHDKRREAKAQVKKTHEQLDHMFDLRHRAHLQA